MEAVLSRMAAADISIEAISISSNNKRLRASDRPFEVDGFPYPIKLSSVPSARDLRLAIGRSSKRVGQPVGSKGGNPTKRLSFVLDWPGAASRLLPELGNLLSSPFDELAPVADRTELARRAGVARRRLRRTGGLMPEPPEGQETPAKVFAGGERYLRDPKVVAWVVEAADHTCEVCGARGFATISGECYIEVHHLVPLAEGGPDTVSNTVAVCAGCHRELHYGAKRQVLADNLYGALPRLQRVPVASPAKAFPTP
jgi:5-methylcytosine-specific restriction endonuclease McrA